MVDYYQKIDKYKAKEEEKINEFKHDLFIENNSKREECCNIKEDNQ